MKMLRFQDEDVERPVEQHVVNLRDAAVDLEAEVMNDGPYSGTPSGGNRANRRTPAPP